MNNNYAEAAVEVLDILKHLTKEERSKISPKFISFLKDLASPNYVPNLDYTKKLDEMTLKEETKNILYIMYYSYLCTDKKAYLQKIIENDKKYTSYLSKEQEKNNLDFSFKKNSDT